MVGATSGTGSAVQSLQELAAAMFKKADVNNDGGITQQEFSASAPQGPPPGGPKGMPPGGQGPDVKQLFAETDEDGDGVIDEDEFQTFIEKMESQRTKDAEKNKEAGGPDPSKMFSKIDTDGDGKVTKDELTAFFQQMESRRAAEATTYNAQGKEQQVNSAAFVDVTV